MLRDSGLETVIRAVGGIGALARALGISQPSVSTWQQIPAKRVLAVEAATGVSRAVLRPDLYAGDGAGAVDEVELARAQEYGLLAALLGRAPDAALLGKLARLRGDASPLGMAHMALADAAAATTAEAVAREFFALFIGLGRGELLPYASYYLTGFLHERPLARVREDMAAFGIARNPEIPEPEDHVAILCDAMAGIIAGEFAAGDGADRRFFDRHLKPWAGRLFADLESAREAKFYRAVGTLGRAFMDIEDQAFAFDAPESGARRASHAQ